MHGESIPNEWIGVNKTKTSRKVTASLWGRFVVRCHFDLINHVVITKHYV